MARTDAHDKHVLIKKRVITTISSTVHRIPTIQSIVLKVSAKDWSVERWTSEFQHWLDETLEHLPRESSPLKYIEISAVDGYLVMEKIGGRWQKGQPREKTVTQ